MLFLAGLDLDSARLVVSEHVPVDLVFQTPLLSVDIVTSNSHSCSVVSEHLVESENIFVRTAIKAPGVRIPLGGASVELDECVFHAFFAVDLR